MIQKMRDSLMRASFLPSREDGGLSFLQLAALIIGPIVAGAIALGAVSSIRLGGDLTGMFTRDAQMNQTVERFQLQLTNITEINVEDQRAFTARDQPSKRNAYYVPSAGMPDVCVSNEWALTDEGGTQTLRNITYTHAEDSCDSDVVSQTERTMTGLGPDTVFVYENAYGRDLHYSAGAEAGLSASVNERPDGLFNNEWGYASPGFVTISGEMNQVIGSTPLDYSAKTPLKQLRPGVVSSDLGELGPPLIERTARGGDTYRAQMSALTVLEDPRTVIEWSWREVKNVGSTPTSLPTEAQWGSWSDWTTLDHFDSTVLQGSKWQVQAKYRVVLEERSAESETVTMTWVRPIDRPEAPRVWITPDTVAAEVAITVIPAACPAGTTRQTQSRYFVNTDAWSPWFFRAASPFIQVVSVPEGAKITANGQARCATVYTVSDWVSNTENPTSVQPITTAPTIETVTAAVAAPEDRGTIQTYLTGCPAGTTYQVVWRWRLNAQTTYANSGAFRDVAERGSYNAAAVREGERFQGGVTARCVSPHFTASPESQAESSWVVNPIRSVPTVTSPTVSVSGATGTVGATINACPAWMTYEARSVGQTSSVLNVWSTSLYGPPTGESAGAATRAFSGTLNEGHALRGGLSARCVTAYAQGDYAEAITSSYAVRPLSAPTVGAATGSLSGGTFNVTASVGSCAAGTTLRVRHGYLLNEEESGWQYSAFANGSAGANTRTAYTGLGEGKRVSGRLSAQCVSAYADSAVTNGATTGWTIRPVTSPSVGAATGNLVNSTGIYTITATVGSCAPGTDLWTRGGRLNDANTDYAYGSFSNTSAGATSKTFTVAINEGKRIRGHMVAECRGTYANSSTTTGSASPWAIRAVTAPTTTTATSSWNSDGDFRATSTIGSCATGTTLQIRGAFLRDGETSADDGWTYRAWSDSTAGSRTVSGPIGAREGTRWATGISVRCDGTYASSSETTRGAGWGTRPVSSPATNDTASASYSGTELRVSATVTSCAAGVTLQIRGGYLRDGETSADDGWSYKSWSNSSGGTRTVVAVESAGQGTRWAGSFSARCMGPEQVSGSRAYSSAVNDSAGWNVRDITSQPSLSTYVSRDGGNTYAGVSSMSGCPSGTNERWRFADRENTGSWSAWSSWKTSTGSYLARTISYGSSMQADWQSQCYRVNTNATVTGPVRDHGELRTSVRPYPTPSAPSSVSITEVYTGPGSRGMNRISWSGSSSSYANDYDGYARVVWSNGNVTNTATTTRTSSSFSAGCFGSTSLGFSSATGYVRASNSTGTSGWTSGTRSTTTQIGSALCS